MSLLAKTIFNDEPAKGWMPWGLLAPVLTFFLITLSLISVMMGILKPAGFVDENLEPIGPTGMALMLFCAFGLAGLVFLAWVKFVEKRSFASIGLSKEKALPTFLKGHLVGVALMLLIVAGITILGGYETGQYVPAFSSPVGLMQIAILLVGFGVQSSVEEYIFRGWLLSVLTRKFNLLAAVLVSSALFTFMHFSPENTLLDNAMTMLFSFFACAWVIRTGNVWGVMGWHAGWNWITATGFELPVTGLVSDTPALLVQLIPVGSASLTGGGMGPEGSYVCSAILAIATLVVMFAPKTKSTS